VRVRAQALGRDRGTIDPAAAGRAAKFGSSASCPPSSREVFSAGNVGHQRVRAAWRSPFAFVADDVSGVMIVGPQHVPSDDDHHLPQSSSASVFPTGASGFGQGESGLWCE
jgi:hypothetical protein